MQLYAFERDKKRFSTLKSMLAKASCKNAEAINMDFLNIDPSHPQYAAVTHMSVVGALDRPFAYPGQSA